MKYDRHDKLAAVPEQPWSNRHAGWIRAVVKKRESESPRENTVGEHLISDHHSRCRHGLVRRDLQWLSGRCQVHHLIACASRDG